MLNSGKYPWYPEYKSSKPSGKDAELVFSLGGKTTVIFSGSWALCQAKKKEYQKQPQYNRGGGKLSLRYKESK